jgi:hypothetical protein
MRDGYPGFLQREVWVDILRMSPYGVCPDVVIGDVDHRFPGRNASFGFTGGAVSDVDHADKIQNRGFSRPRIDLAQSLTIPARIAK